jgi:uncharacterized protein YraI
MRLLALAGAVLAVMAATAAAAQAAPGVVTANVNMRTGPDTEFPSVGIVPEGAPIEVFGCLNDESWCDVAWEGNRGWVFSEYLGFDYRGEVTPLPDVGPAFFRIPVVVFSARDYWGRYYVGRPWYRDRDRWFGFHIHAREGWHAPPPGLRRPGWWRQGYHVPGGMRAPVEHWRHGEHDHHDRDHRDHDHHDHDHQ